VQLVIDQALPDMDHWQRARSVRSVHWPATSDECTTVTTAVAVLALAVTSTSMTNAVSIATSQLL
jgi:hypothetical protein